MNNHETSLSPEELHIVKNEELPSECFHPNLDVMPSFQKVDQSVLSSGSVSPVVHDDNSSSLHIKIAMVMAISLYICGAAVGRVQLG